MSDETKLNPDVLQLADLLSKNMSIGEDGVVEVHMSRDLEAKMRLNATFEAHMPQHVRIYNEALHAAIRDTARQSTRRMRKLDFKRRSLMSYINQAMPDYPQLLEVQESSSYWKNDPQLLAIMRGCHNRHMRGKYVLRHKGKKSKR